MAQFCGVPKSIAQVVKETGQVDNLPGIHNLINSLYLVHYSKNLYESRLFELSILPFLLYFDGKERESFYKFFLKVYIFYL